MPNRLQRGVGTSGYERCHSHEDKARDALNRPVVEKTITSDESRFNLIIDDNRVRVCSPRGESLNHVFALQRRPAPTAGLMPAQSPDLSPIEHIWDHLGRRVEHPTSLNELEEIWNEMSQDIIQNAYTSMPDRIASCIHARDG
ncbi:transposable element Tcb2 transposase [Trichonephila clavipes]|nr:transposable element Tcb2 transposase [Trichonephila clavipes]